MKQEIYNILCQEILLKKGACLLVYSRNGRFDVQCHLEFTCFIYSNTINYIQIHVLVRFKIQSRLHIFFVFSLYR